MTEPSRHGWSSVRFCGWCKRPFPESRREQLYCNDTHKRFARRKRSAERKVCAVAAGFVLFAAFLTAQVPTPVGKVPLFIGGGKVIYVSPDSLGMAPEGMDPPYAVSIVSAQYAMTQSPTRPAMFSRYLPDSFLSPGGKAQIDAPREAGQWFMHMKWDWTINGEPRPSLYVSEPFTVLEPPPPPPPTEIPLPTPTPCIVGIYGYPGGYRCYDCAGRIVPGAMPISATKCGPAPMWTRTPARTPTTPPTPTPDTSCVPDASTLCLNSNRFAVQAVWKKPDGETGQASVVPLTTDAGYMWFFSASNPEMLVKVVDGRAFNEHFWVFAGGLTNVRVDLTVTDTETAQERTYVNEQGTAFAPIQDTAAFPIAGQEGGPGWTLAGAIAAVLAAGGGSYFLYRRKRLS